uniref:Mitochondria-eating protein C-terminal domain-containing protein n=1 Tax=Clytia hemisphaerica TaxID=252671 RepID=A0A7M5XEB5_9CNID
YSSDSKSEIHFPIGNSKKTRGFEIGEMTLYMYYLLDVGSADMRYVKYLIERKGYGDQFYKEGKECRQAMEKLMGFISADEIKNNFLIQININFKSMLNQAAQPYSTNDLSTITNILHWSKQLLSLLKDVHKDKLRKCEKRKEPEKKKQPEQEQKLETATAQDIKNSVRTVTMENSSKDLIETLRGKHEQLQSELNRERKKNCDLHEANRIAEKEASQARKIIEEKQDEIVSLRKENEDCRNRISSMMMSQEVGTTSSQNLLDINRPSIVKDKFRLLYVNEYNDVLSAWDQLSEKECSDYLLEILFDANDLCNQYANKFTGDVTNSLECIFKKMPFSANNTYKGNKHILEFIHENLKNMPHESIQEQFCKLVLQRHEKRNPELAQEKYDEMISKYIMGCVSVTWLMNCCLPPIYITKDVGEKFNKKLHTKFSGRGDYVQFYLWPCLFTSEDEFKSGLPAFAKGDVYVGKRPPSLKGKKVEEVSNKNVPVEETQCKKIKSKDVATGPGIAVRENCVAEPKIDQKKLFYSPMEEKRIVERLQSSGNDPPKDDEVIQLAEKQSKQSSKDGIKESSKSNLNDSSSSALKGTDKFAERGEKFQSEKKQELLVHYKSDEISIDPQDQSRSQHSERQNDHDEDVSDSGRSDTPTPMEIDEKPPRESKLPELYENISGIGTRKPSKSDYGKSEVKTTGTVIKTTKVTTITYSNAAKLTRPPIRSSTSRR